MLASRTTLSTEDFNQSVRDYRACWGLTQEQFAQRFGCDARSVRRWESGAVKPSRKNRQQLAVCLRAGEETMKRRDFLKKAQALSLTFATKSEQSDLAESRRASH
jgi:ribosome-binding protein aMBF1 (putative translation factor)